MNIDFRLTWYKTKITPEEFNTAHPGDLATVDQVKFYAPDGTFEFLGSRWACSSLYRELKNAGWPYVEVRGIFGQLCSMEAVSVEGQTIFDVMPVRNLEK